MRALLVLLVFSLQDHSRFVETSMTHVGAARQHSIKFSSAQLRLDTNGCASSQMPGKLRSPQKRRAVKRARRMGGHVGAKNTWRDMDMPRRGQGLMEQEDRWKICDGATMVHNMVLRLRGAGRAQKLRKEKWAQNRIKMVKAAAKVQRIAYGHRVITRPYHQHP